MGSFYCVEEIGILHSLFCPATRLWVATKTFKPSSITSKRKETSRPHHGHCPSKTNSKTVIVHLISPSGFSCGDAGTSKDPSMSPGREYENVPTLGWKDSTGHPIASLPAADENQPPSPTWDVRQRVITVVRLKQV